MFEVGAYIVHPGQGVCRVEGVGEGPDATYKLLPLGQRHPVHISYPVASCPRASSTSSRAPRTARTS